MNLLRYVLHTLLILFCARITNLALHLSVLTLSNDQTLFTLNPVFVWIHVPTNLRRSQILRTNCCRVCYHGNRSARYSAVKTSVNVSGARPASVSLELRSDSGVMSHWKDYDRLAAFSFLSHEPAASFQRTPTDTIPVPMVPQVGDFRAGRIHQLNAHGVELPLEVGLKSQLYRDSHL